MAKDSADAGGAVSRPLDLDPQRAGRAVRAPYAIVDIGSNSVRLVVYDQLGRAPLPRFNEKSLCRLGDRLAQTGAIAPEGFRRTIQAARRFRAIADAMGVAKIDVTGTEAIRRASNGPALVAAIAAESGLNVRILSGAEEARFSALGVISGFFRPIGTVGDMGGGSLEVAEALDDRVGDRWVSLPLGALPVEAMLAEGAAEAKRRIDAMLQAKLPPALGRPAFYAVGGGWRALAKAHMEAVDAPVKVVHGYTLAAEAARGFAKSLLRLSPARLAATPGVPERRADTLPAAALVLDRLLKRLAPERVVFSALGLREGLLYSQLAVEEQYLDPLVEGRAAHRPAGGARARFRPRARAVDGRALLRRDAGRDAPARRGLRAFRHRLARPARTCAPRKAFAACCGSRSSASITPSAPSSPPRSTPATPAGPTRPGSARPSTSSRLRPRRRAQILGRAILLAYRFSGVVPAVLVSARLRIEPDCVRLEVAAAARAPDSEVVVERLQFLAGALDVRRSEIVVIDTAS